MDEMDENEPSSEVVGAANEVHRVVGPGLLESVYRLRGDVKRVVNNL